MFITLSTEWKLGILFYFIVLFYCVLCCLLSVTEKYILTWKWMPCMNDNYQDPSFLLPNFRHYTFFIENRFFSHTVHLKHSFHSIPPHTTIHLLSVSAHKRAGIQETTNKTKYSNNNTRQKSSHWVWTRQCNRKKRIPSTGRKVKHTPDPTVRNPTKHANSNNMYTKDLVQTHAGIVLATSVSIPQNAPC